MSSIEDRIRQLTEDSWDVDSQIILDDILEKCDTAQAIEQRRSFLDRVRGFLDAEHPVFSKLYGVHLSDSCFTFGFFLTKSHATKPAVDGFRLGFAILDSIDSKQLSNEEKASYVFEAVSRCSKGDYKIEDKTVFEAICREALAFPIIKGNPIQDDIINLRREIMKNEPQVREAKVDEHSFSVTPYRDTGNVPSSISMDTPVPLDDIGLYNGVHKILGVPDRRLVAADIDLITELDLQGCGIQWIDCLQAFPILTSLSLADNKIRDISPLAYLTRLESLNLHGNRLMDVNPLSKLSRLSVLNLSDNVIFNVKPLSKLTELKHLDLRNNHLRGTNDLRHLVNLEYLDLSGNPVMEYSGLESMNSLKLVRMNDEPLNEWVLNKLHDRGVKVEFVGES